MAHAAVVDADRRLDRITRSQQGLFTHTQARACGYSADQIRRRLANGQWRRVVGTVLSAGPTAAGAWDRAVQLSVPGSVLAGPSAARAFGLDARLTGDVRLTGTVISVDRRIRKPPPGVRILRDDLARTDVHRLSGLLVTSLGRTVFDCARLLAPKPALDLLDRALQQNWISLAELADRVRGHVGRHGSPHLVSLMSQVSGGSRFAAERRAAALLRAAGITGWLANAPIHDRLGLIGQGDLVFPIARVVVELDGLAYHVTPEQFQRDRRRQNRLVAAGWRVLRFTWRDITERPDQFVAAVRAMVTQ